jgi:energy-coupling factor transporter ATP-binding protein EcfA2
MTEAPRNAVEFDRVSIVFGDHPDRALPLMDAGQSRAEIQQATGQVLGVHDCTLSVAEGEILVLMGLSGSGKSTLLRGVNALNPVVRGEVRVLDGDRMVSVTKANRRCPAPPARHPNRHGVPAVRPVALAHRARKRRPWAGTGGRPAERHARRASMPS